MYSTCKPVNIFISVYTDIEAELAAIMERARSSKYLIIIVIFVKYTTPFKTYTDVIHCICDLKLIRTSNIH